MSETNQGLFLCKRLNPYKKETGDRYCKIIGISVYTPQLTYKKMLVAYKVAYWDNEPISIEQFSNFELYRSSIHGMIIHTFEVSKEELTKEELIVLCQQHFKESYSGNYTPTILTENISKLYYCKNKHFKKSRTVPGTISVVWDILHKLRYESHDGLELIRLDNKIMFRGNFVKSNIEQYNWIYNDNDYIEFNANVSINLFDPALNCLDQQSTIDYCNQYFLRN